MVKSKIYDVIVIGGGAAGLLAAGSAASLSDKVLILEKKNALGRKLAITGKGRCNITNTAKLPEFIKHFGENGRFLRTAFSNFFSEDLIKLLNNLGVETAIERGGRYFPVSEKATDIVDALVKWIKINEIKFKTESAVSKLIVQNNVIKGVESDTGIKYYSRAVILTTGGLSYPATGSTGDGYPIAKSVGHTIIPPKAALIPLITAGTIAPALQGLSLKNVSASMWLDGKKVCQEFGEMLFTHFGLSGPIILTLSREFVSARIENPHAPLELSIDLKPALDHKKLDDRIQRDFSTHGKKQFHTVLKGLAPGKLADLIPELVEIDPEKLNHQITAMERKRLRNFLKDFRFRVKGPRSIKEAIVTAGGVSTREIDAKTMQSKIVAGLYFAGEVIDIDGDTGGFNLQAAFSTGWLAGHSAVIQA